ncbi:MAG: zinc dependent phospholipase C family protein [Lachnospiraceae bacterium]|nr:zinc dependent phospholipase C family protein [Lachnospiraceae bacterium]
MPTTYAHYKLGDEVRKQLNPQAKEIVEAYPELFQIGLHGPDLLFYYNALSKNKVNTLGYRLHEHSGREFFEKAARVLEKHQDSQAHISYILGFLCHFTLDVTCHGFVNESVDKQIADHLEIEAELDREILLRDGLNPEKAILTGHLNAKEENARVIKDFFPELSEEEVKKSISDMIFYLNLLVPKGRFKRTILTTALKLAGKYETYKGLIINKEKNQYCEQCTDRLLTLFEEGKVLAVRLLNEYMDYLDGRRALDPVYEYNFDSKLKDWEKQ